MTSLKDRFDKIRADITDPAKTVRHYPLLGILEEVNTDRSRTFDPDALTAEGIDPTEFRTAWAIGFARETLGFRNTTFDVWREAAMNRCETCLSETEGYKFGEVLPDALKQEIAQKLDALRLHR